MPSLPSRLHGRAVACGTVLLALALLGTGLPGAYGDRAAAPSGSGPVRDGVSGARSPGPVADPAPQAGAAAPRRIIVRWKHSATTRARRTARATARTKAERALGSSDFQLLRPESGQSLAEAVAALRADPRVASAEPDQYLTTYGAPNDPDLPLQWSLRNSGDPLVGFADGKRGGDIDVVPAWDRTVGTPGTVVAVIDGGYDFLSPDLAPVVWTNAAEISGNGIDDDDNGKVDDVHGWDFVGAEMDSPVEDSDPTDDDARGGGHGLHVSGIIGAKGNDGHGITGVAQDVRLMPLRVCSWSTTLRANTCSLSGLIAAINYAGAMGARVANMSLGGTEFSSATRDALAANPRTLYVAAAGNNGRDTEKYPAYPCSYSVGNLICVAASDQADDPASFSNWGARSVDLAAPGVGIWSLYRTGTMFSDDFSVNDVATRWTSSGLGFGRGLAGDGKLVSPGLTDSPGTAPAEGLHEVVSTPVAIPSNVEICRVQGDRYSKAGEGSTFDYSVLVDGQTDPNLVFAPIDSTTSLMRGFITTPFDGTLIAGKSISLKFSYQAAAGLDAAYGVWLDNLKVICARTAAKPALYEYLSGTSMASPMVAGAAALLFSLKPTASTSQVRSALLGSVDRLPAWAGLTATGGRLDVAAAMGRLVPPNTRFVSPVAVSGQTVTLNVAQVGSLASVRFQCRLDSGTWLWCNPAGVLRGLHPGRHVVATRAVDPYGNADPTPASSSFTITGCLVPRLVGASWARVRAVMPGSGCRVGTVIRPRGVVLSKLRVKAVYPRAGSYLPTGTALKLVLVRR